MDITATEGNFYVATFSTQKINYDWANGGLSFSTKEKSVYPISVQTNRGDFVECVNDQGVVTSEGGDGDWYYVHPSKMKQSLRFKKLPKISLTRKELDKQRKSVTRWLVSDSPYGLGIPNDLNGVLKWFHERLAEIPKVCRDSASVDFGSRSSYGESYENIAITYEENETDEELILRLQVEAERSRVSRLKKQAKLEKLQAELST